VRNFLDHRYPRRWIGRSGSVEYPPRSPNLAPLDFYLCGDLKNTVYTRRPRTFQGLSSETEISYAAIPPAALRELCQLCNFVAHLCQKCIGVGGGHFERLRV
jgi:hypothetical protein